MEGGVGLMQQQHHNQQQQDQSHQQQQQAPQQPPQQPVERLNQEVVQLLNLESVKTRAISLSKAISRILEDFNAYARTNTTPKWQDILGQYSMVNLELFNIVEEVRKVSKAFVVHPKNVNAENANILPIMLSTKLLPEMESDDNSKKDQLLLGVQNLPIPMQIERLKARMDMIGAACENAEKVIADTRKAYGFGTRQGPAVLPTLDKVQAAKIQEQENLLRAAVNYGEGIRLPEGQRQITTSLPPHLADVLNDGGQSFIDPSGKSMYMKNTPPLSSNNIGSQGNLLQASGAQLLGRAAASPSGATSANFENSTTSPLPYANSPRSGVVMMNTPSPQQQNQQQLLQQQQREKLMQMPQHQQQLLAAQQQLRQSAMQGLGQNQMPSLHDLQGQGQQKFQTLHGQHQMQYSQPMGHQQFQSRQLSTGHIQHGLAQSQLNQANQLNRHLGQFSGTPNSALLSAAQGAPTSQMVPNMSTMPSQTLLPRMQYGLGGTTTQRGHASQILGDQMFNIGGTNPGGMMPLQSQQQQQQQQQQSQQQGGFGNMQPNAQNLQPNMVGLQNQQQNHPNFQQQRQPNQR